MISNKLKTVLNFFKTSLITIAVGQFLVVCVVLVMFGLKESYGMKLKEEFATKQPHIKIEYISKGALLDDATIIQQIDTLTKLSRDIALVSPFLKGDKNLQIVGYKEGGNAFYNGDVTIIGVGKEGLIYNFFEQSFIEQQPMGVSFTSLEFYTSWLDNENLSVFNTTLLKSFYPVIGAVSKFDVRDSKDVYPLRLSGSFNDFNAKAIIYTSIENAKTILGQKSIDGYFINAKKLEQIDTLIATLKNELPTDKFIISSWIEDKQKQLMIFHLFENMFFIIVAIVILLTFIISMLLIYNAIVKKSYQLTVFKWLGYLFSKEIFVSLSVALVVPSVLASLVYIYSIDFTTTYFGLPSVFYMVQSHILYICWSVSVYILLGYFVIQEAYSANISQSLE